MVTDRDLAHARRGSVRLTRVEPELWWRLRDVRLAALEESPRAFTSGLAKEQAFTEADWRRRAAGSLAFIASRGDIDVGMGGVYESEGSWWAWGVWVRPDSRGSGVVEHLMSASERAVQESGADIVWLRVMEDNLRGRRAYQRLGYQVVGRGECSTTGPRDRNGESAAYIVT